MLNKVNRDVAEHEAKERARAERDEQRSREREESIRQVASRLKFD
ncbi:MAG: hypothetical protein ABR583_03715 [Gaiellaceae bacterium]